MEKGCMDIIRKAMLNHKFKLKLKHGNKIYGPVSSLFYPKFSLRIKIRSIERGL